MSYKQSGDSYVNKRSLHLRIDSQFEADVGLTLMPSSFPSRGLAGAWQVANTNFSLRSC